jgi:hypothetical protein
MCAWRSRRGRARLARQNTNCVCRRFASESFLSFVPFVIRAEAALAKRCHQRSGASHQHGPPGKPGGDDF